jgi:hypothetical protein
LVAQAFRPVPHSLERLCHQQNRPGGHMIAGPFLCAGGHDAQA